MIPAPRIVAAVVVAAIGCNRPHYSFEPRPPAPAPPADEAERCCREQRYELAMGVGSFTSYSSVPVMGRSISGDTTLTNVVVAESFQEGGLVVYQGGKRLDVREALRRVGDPAVERGYARVRAPTAGAHAWYPLWRVASLFTTGLAVGAVLGGAGWATATGFDDTAPLYLMLGGGIGLLVSLIPTTGALITKNDHFLHERKLQIFHDAEFASVLVEGVRAANQRAAAGCSHGAADLPMTPRARRALGYE